MMTDEEGIALQMIRPNFSQYVTARDARRLRWARNQVRGYARRLAVAAPGKADIVKARYQGAVALLATHALLRQSVRRDRASQPLPINPE